MAIPADIAVATAQIARAATSFDTQQLHLEPLTACDARDIAQVLADPRLYEHTCSQPLEDDALERRFELLEKGGLVDGLQLWLNWTLRIRSSDEAIPHVQATVEALSTATIA